MFVPKEYVPQTGTDGLDCDWAVHPGGPLILRAIEDALSLKQWQMQSSWDVLADNGNMSSATLIFVLQHLRRARLPRLDYLLLLLFFGVAAAMLCKMIRHYTTFYGESPLRLECFCY